MFTLLINEGDGTGAQSWDRYYEVLWQEMRKRLKKEQQRCQFWFWYDCATNAKPKAIYLSVQFSSVAQSCPTLWDPMDCSTPGFPGHHQLPKLAQTHVHRVSDAIQSSHPLSSPSPPAFNLSQHQGLFQWISSSHRRPKYQSFSFSISPSNEYSVLISFWNQFGLISFLSKGLSRIFSNTTVQKHQLFGTQLSLWSNSHIHTWPLEKPWPWLDGPYSAK